MFKFLPMIIKSVTVALSFSITKHINHITKNNHDFVFFAWV